MFYTYFYLTNSTVNSPTHSASVVDASSRKSQILVAIRDDFVIEGVGRLSSHYHVSIGALICFNDRYPLLSSTQKKIYKCLSQALVIRCTRLKDGIKICDGRYS